MLHNSRTSFITSIEDAINDDHVGKSYKGIIHHPGAAVLVTVPIFFPHETICAEGNGNIPL